MPRDRELLSFEKSRPGRSGLNLAIPGEWVDEARSELGGLARGEPPLLPELSELETVRHFSALARLNHGVDDDFYPLGSCTMKYNPKLNEELAAHQAFLGVHPAMPEVAVQGWLAVYHHTERMLAEITGMDAVTFHPMAGAHGELTGMMLVRAWHESRGRPRRKVLVPDSAHGTNPASAALCGFEVVNVPSGEDGLLHPDTLRQYLDEDVAALMLTNPNTLGLFEAHVEEVAALLHAAGALLYYDGANLNAIVGRIRPGDMGFDVVHLNLHKTFSTPHGGGGPGAGPVGVKEDLEPFLPVPRVVREGEGGPYRLSSDFPRSIGRIGSWYGNALVVLKAYLYMLNLGGRGLREVSAKAVLNARYLERLLAEQGWKTAYGQHPCMHEFVLSGRDLPNRVRTVDVAKRIIDAGYHPPTVYFPLIVREALMVEPTETEPPEKLEEFAAAMARILREAQDEPEVLKSAPHSTPVGRLDEARAARLLELTWSPRSLTETQKI